MGKNLRSELRTLRRIVAAYPTAPFTREDVAQLHKAADAIDSEWGYPGGRGIEEHKPGQPLRELADRIEALLLARELAVD